MNAVCPLGDLGSGTGLGEILLVFAAVLVLFGPRKLPEFARTLGRILEGLRRASSEFRDQVMRLEDDALPPRSAGRVGDGVQVPDPAPGGGDVQAGAPSGEVDASTPASAE